MYVCRRRYYHTNLVSFVVFDIFVLVSFISRLVFCSVLSLFLFRFIFSESLVAVRILELCGLETIKYIYFDYIYNAIFKILFNMFKAEYMLRAK